MDSDPLLRKVLLADAWGTYLSFYGPYIAVLPVLLALAAIVSASEAAFFSLTPDDRALCRTSDDSAGRRITFLLDRPRRLLASLLIFNNLLNLAIVVIITYFVWNISQINPEPGWILTALIVVMTLTIVLFGEIIPKVYASQNSLSVARRTAPLVSIASTIFKPLSVLLVRLTNVVEERIERRGYKVSMEELNQAVDLTSSESTHEERELLKGIVNFSNLTARQVMRARLDITALNQDLKFGELLEQINQAGYSRVPVYQGTLDQVEGILYIKDLLPHIDKDDSFAWQTLLRPAFFIPETKKIDGLLQDFQKRRVHMAVVVDEYGGTRGLITLEDIIEEIFGDINDEFDEEEPVSYQRIDERTILTEGKVLLVDICRVLHVDTTYFDEVRGGSESLGGLLLELFTRVPDAGEEVSYGPFTFRIVSADDKRIQHVQITRQEVKEEVSVDGD